MLNSQNWFKISFTSNAQPFIDFLPTVKSFLDPSNGIIYITRINIDNELFGTKVFLYYYSEVFYNGVLYERENIDKLYLLLKNKELENIIDKL